MSESSFNSNSIEIYVFDCDGVVIDSGEDIADSVNRSLKEFGYWQVESREIVSFMGDGVTNLLLRTLARSTKNHFNLESEHNKNEFEKIKNFYLELYYKNPVVKTRLYAGIRELLRVLKEKNKKVAMLTNKPAAIAERILERLNVREYFDFVIGPESEWKNGEKIKMKPSPDGLRLVLSKINEKENAVFTAKNMIMIGDSAVDIIAGKEAGCKTVGLRGGIGNTEKLLEQNPDLCFSVASEIEKFIDILSGTDGSPESSGISEIEDFAMKNEVPIMQDEGIEFICGLIKKRCAKKILEIGTAIGYSAIKFASLSPEISVTTIEIDEKRYKTAQKNVEGKGFQKKITLIHADALDADLNGKFDLIFIDAAKAQYVKFFEKYKKNLEIGGVIVCDNLSFHGMVEDLSLTHNYSTKKLVKKIRKFIEFLKSNEEFETEFIKKGDGISVSRKK